MNFLKRALWSLLLLCVPALAQSDMAALTRDRAIALAVAADPWLAGSAYRQQALSDEAAAANSLPDPRINMTAAHWRRNKKSAWRNKSPCYVQTVPRR